MKREAMIIAALSDIAGKVRGKAFPEYEFSARLKRGIGWTPTNVQITCFDTIAETPFGALGDLVLLPDPETLIKADYGDELPAERFVLGDILETTGEPWQCCTRSILKAALDRLNSTTGLSLFGSFEHEFHFTNVSCPLGSAYTTSGYRAERQFSEILMAIFGETTIGPDTFMKEYGVDQYEVTVDAVTDVAIADQAVQVRELVRTTGEHLGRNVSFSPLRDPDGVGNGVHIHMSFKDNKGDPATFDPSRPYGLGETAGKFIAGILKYLDRIVAITAPSMVSYTRLTPHRWSAAFNNLGYRDREAAIRIAPTSSLSDIPEDRQYNFEFRAADAAASPYLALAAIVHAGVQGIEENLICPDATEDDISLWSAKQLADHNLVRLPQSLSEALNTFGSDKTVTGWFPPGFADIYIKHKQAEMAFLKDKSEAEVCKAYEATY